MFERIANRVCDEAPGGELVRRVPEKDLAVWKGGEEASLVVECIRSEGSGRHFLEVLEANSDQPLLVSFVRVDKERDADGSDEAGLSTRKDSVYLVILDSWVLEVSVVWQPPDPRSDGVLASQGRERPESLCKALFGLDLTDACGGRHVA